MKRLLLLILLFTGLFAQAQINLVRNPSFETHWRCPQYFDLVKYANYWTSINDTVVSVEDTIGVFPNVYLCLPEYCNVCSNHPIVRIPEGQAYTQVPRNGDGMMQVQMYYSEEDTTFPYKRDYLQGRLRNVLTVGEQYCVQFYVCLAGESAFGINKIGAYFDDGTIDTTVNCGLVQSTHIPQVFHSSIIIDTVNWIKIQGVFTANGTEKFLTISNFFEALNIDTIRTNFPHALAYSNTSVSWYLIDDISVIKVGTVAFAGNDTTIYEGDTAWLGEHVNYVGDSVRHNDFDDYAPVKWYTVTGALIDSNHSGLMVHPVTTTSYVMELDVCGALTYDTVTVTVLPVGVDGAISASPVRTYPNPAADVLHVSGLAEAASYRLVNALGVCVAQGDLGAGDNTIDMARFSRGVYVLELSAGDGRRCVRVLKM